MFNIKTTFKKISIFIFVLLFVAISSKVAFADGAGEITTSKSSETTDTAKEKVNIYIDETKTVGLETTPKILFLGSLCENHGLTIDIIAESLYATAKFGDVEYHLFQRDRDLKQLITPVQGTLSMNSDLNTVKKALEGISLKGSAHCTQYDFAHVLKNATLDESSGEKVHYDYIVMEFDGLRMGYYYNETSLKQEDKDAINAAATVLKEYYAKDKVAWIISNDAGEDNDVYPYDYEKHQSGTTSTKISTHGYYINNDLYMDNDYRKILEESETKKYRLHVRELIKLVAPEDLVDGEIPDERYCELDKDGKPIKITDTFKTLRDRLSKYDETQKKYVSIGSGKGIWVYYSDAEEVFNFLQKKIGKSTVSLKDIVAQGLVVKSVTGQYKELDASGAPTGEYKDIKTDGAFTYKITEKVTYDTNKVGTQIDATFDMSKIYGSTYTLNDGNAVRVLIKCEVGDNLIIPTGTTTTADIETNGGEVEIDVVVGPDLEEKDVEDIPTIEIECVDVKYNFKGTVPSGATKPDDKTVKKDHAFTSTAPDAVTGYTFDGWYTDEGCTTKYTDKTVLTADLNLYGKWSPITYQIKFNGNGSTSGTMNNQTLTYDVASNLSTNGFSKTGYVFKGWSTTATGTVEYAAGASVKNLKDTQDAVFNLYAVWEPITYTVEYDKNGGTGTTIASDTFTYDSTTDTIKKNDDAYKRTGYTYKGWDKSSTATTATYKGGETSTKFNFKDTQDATQTLYAVWSPNSYTVTYDANKPSTASGSISGTMADQSFKYDQKATALTNNAFSLKGWIFNGWTGSDGKTYTNKQEVQNLTSEDGETITMSANWTANTYKVTFDKNKPATASSSVTGTTSDESFAYDADSKPLTTNGYTLTGWTFTGWNTQADGKGTSYDDKESVQNLTSKNGETVTLYAQWKENGYTVKFHDNKPDTASGTISQTMTDQSFKYETTKNLTDNAYSLTGWTFDGWATTAKGAVVYTDKQSVSKLSSTDGATIDLYAHWTANTYKVTFDKNKPATASSSVTGTTSDESFTYDADSKPLTTNGYTLTGWTFTGWNTQADGKGTSYDDKASVQNLTSTNDETVTLYAQWSPNSYSVTFDSNKPSTASGTISGTMSDQDFKYDTEKALSDNKYSLTGWTFTGWKDEVSSKTYTDKQSVKNLTSVDEGEVTLKAQWTPITYTVKYDSNGGKGTTIPSSNFTYDSITDVIKTNDSYTKTGYTFLGWSTDSEATTATYTGGETGTKFNLTSTDKGSVTLYAVWSPITYDVVYNGNNATSGSMDKSTFTYDEEDNLKENEYVRTGHVFLGWSKDSTAETATYDDQELVKNLASNQGDTVNLYAVWHVNAFNINIIDHDGGTVTTDPEDTAEVGSKVSVLVNIDKGYSLKKLKVTNNTTGEEIELDNDDSFIMPDSDVTVEATFSKSTPIPDPGKKDESCEKVIGPTWHWNNTKGVCEEVEVVGTRTR